MKIFVQLKVYFKISGIEPNQPHFFNRKNLLALFLLAYCFSATVLLILFEDISFIVLGNTFYAAISFFLNFFTLSSNIIKQVKIFKFIDKLEKVIGSRKF